LSKSRIVYSGQPTRSAGSSLLSLFLRGFFSLSMGGLLGCGTAAVRGTPIAVPVAELAGGDVNLLTASQSTLAVPPGWYFSGADDKPTNNDQIKSSTLFSFKDRENRCLGKFQYVQFPNMPGTIDSERLADTYATKGLASLADDITIHATRIDGKSAQIITGHTKKGNLDLFVAMVPEGRAFNAIMLMCDPGVLFGNPEMAYRIFGSYRFAPKNLHERTIPGVWGFRDRVGEWVWANDVRNNLSQGYLTVSIRDDQLVAIAVAKTTAANPQDLVADFRTRGVHPTGEPRAVTLSVGGRMVAGTFVPMKSEKAASSNTDAILFVLPEGNKTLTLVYDPALLTRLGVASIDQAQVVTSFLEKNLR
jgi:hypothetical protein